MRKRKDSRILKDALEAADDLLAAGAIDEEQHSEFFTKMRTLAIDYPEQANARLRAAGWTDADFKAARQPDDHPRRTASKRALLETIRLARKTDQDK